MLANFESLTPSSFTFMYYIFLLNFEYQLFRIVMWNVFNNWLVSTLPGYINLADARYKTDVYLLLLSFLDPWS